MVRNQGSTNKPKRGQKADVRQTVLPTQALRDNNFRKDSSLKHMDKLSSPTQTLGQLQISTDDSSLLAHLVLAVPLKMLAHRHGLLDEVVKVLRDLRGKACIHLRRDLTTRKEK
jgi:hypothetical protein